MPPCKIDSAKDNGRNKRYHQENAGNDDAGRGLPLFGWWCQTRLNAVAVTLSTLSALTTRVLGGLWENMLCIIACLEWLRWRSKLARSRIASPHRRSWKALLWIAALRALTITSWHY